MYFYVFYSLISLIELIVDIGHNISSHIRIRRFSHGKRRSVCKKTEDESMCAEKYALNSTRITLPPSLPDCSTLPAYMPDCSVLPESAWPDEVPSIMVHPHHSQA